MQKEHRDKCREHEQLKRLLVKQREDLAFFRSQLEERDRLIEVSKFRISVKQLPARPLIFLFVLQENGLLVITNEEENGLNNSHHDEDPLNDTNHIDYKRKLSNRILISSQSAELLQTLGEGSLGSILFIWFFRSRTSLLIHVLFFGELCR